VAARQLRSELGSEEAIVLGFDRGGFCFEVLENLNHENFGYVGWVPASATLPDLSKIAPANDGVGEQLWAHPKMSAKHKARLLVQRDGEVLVPAVTNLPGDIPADEALKMLRRVRGWQENDIKATRAFAHIDRLVDSGGARRAREDRPVNSPERRELSKKRKDVCERFDELERHQPSSEEDFARWQGQRLMAELEQDVYKHRLKNVPAKVPCYELDPNAERGWLETRNRSLLHPLKYVLANGRRWLLAVLGV
jgi:hypothetical protein